MWANHHFGDYTGLQHARPIRRFDGLGCRFVLVHGHVTALCYVADLQHIINILSTPGRIAARHCANR